MKRVLVCILVLTGVARAQPDVLQPATADPTTCARIDTTPGAPLDAVSTPIDWTELQIQGDLLDPPATVRDLIAPTLAPLHPLTGDGYKLVAQVVAKFGYQLLAHTAEGTRLVLYLRRLPVIRKVHVDVSQGVIEKMFDKPFDEEIERRMRLRPGMYLPWEPVHRQCALIDELERVREYLVDEGYFDATLTPLPELNNDGTVNLRIKAALDDEYQLGRLDIARQASGEQLAFSDAAIRDVFEHGTSRFTRAQHLEDLQTLKKMFQQRGYPAVRVQSSLDLTSYDRRTKRVNLIITIDQRRHLEVQFEGDDRGGVTDDELRAQLTFDDAGSSDDVEAAQSAQKLVTFLQQRGFFDARVTWTRERFESRAQSAGFDRLTFRIEAGPIREVKRIEFTGNHYLTDAQLADVVATKEASFDVQSALFGAISAATSEQLAIDERRIEDAYRRAGYREASAHVTVSPEELGLKSSALTAAIVLGGDRSDLIVRYAIDEGQPTLLTQIEIEGAGDMCDQILGELTRMYEGIQRDAAGDNPDMRVLQPRLANIRRFGKRVDPQRCIAMAPDVLFREDDVAGTRDRLRDWLFRQGRPRATVDYDASELEPHRVKATYRVSRIKPLTIGKIVVRGNFRTRSSVIYGELEQGHFVTGQPLTTDAIAEGARRLRNTGLFASVNIDLPEIENRDSTSSVVNAIVQIEERYDFLARIDLAAGYSTYSGWFATMQWAQRNLFGAGIAFLPQVTVGTQIFDLEGTLSFPPWLVRPLPEFRTDITGILKTQDTPRFGRLDTQGFTVALTKQWIRPRLGRRRAWTMTLSPHYDFRLRSRNVDVLRPIGVDMDQSQVAVPTRTGSIGVTYVWDARVDRTGAPAPLAPEGGFYLEAGASLAEPWLLGQDRFVKTSLSASKFQLIGSNLILRGDFRYDEGFPLGGAVLLPEVERFFAGGDNTVRGYNDDRLATEIVQVGVPPLGNVSQIRIIPAGGNIRMLASLDAQLRIWSIFAGAVFSDAGMITNEWSSVTRSAHDLAQAIRPSVGTGLRLLTPFGIAAFEYAVPLNVQLGDDPRGRWHVYFAARAQF